MQVKIDDNCSKQNPAARVTYRPPADIVRLRMPESASAPPAGNRKLLIDAAIVIALLVLGAAGYLLAPMLTPRTDVALPLSPCDLAQGPCSVTLPGGGRVEIAISPTPIPALKPLRLLAVVSGADVQKIEIDFAGVDMKMGYNRPQLENLGEGRFAGQGNLPVCITGKMPWEATVLIEAGRTVIAAPFRFDVEG